MGSTWMMTGPPTAYSFPSAAYVSDPYALPPSTATIDVAPVAIEVRQIVSVQAGSIVYRKWPSESIPPKEVPLKLNRTAAWSVLATHPSPVGSPASVVTTPELRSTLRIDPVVAT